MAGNMLGRPGGSPHPILGRDEGYDTVAEQQHMQEKLTVHGNSTDDILTQVLLKNRQVS